MIPSISPTMPNNPQVTRLSDQLDHAFLGVSQNELVGSGPAEKDAEKAGEQFLLRPEPVRADG